MILPGTLVQYLAEGLHRPKLRPLGIYTVQASFPADDGGICAECGTSDCDADRVGILLRETDPEPKSDRWAGYFSIHGFRIVAPPITDADRLEASAPTGDAPAKPKRVKA